MLGLARRAARAGAPAVGRAAQAAPKGSAAVQEGEKGLKENKSKIWIDVAIGGGLLGLLGLLLGTSRLGSHEKLGLLGALGVVGVVGYGIFDNECKECGMALDDADDGYVYESAVTDLEKCAEFASNAYYDDSRTSWLGDIELVAQDECEAKYGYDKDDANHLVIVFRGTEMTSHADMLTDLKVVKKPMVVPSEDGKGEVNIGLVHTGFHDYYSSLREAEDQKLLKVIDEHCKAGNDKNRISFVGHSLGASVGLLAVEAKTKYPSTHMKLVTFGAPRLGNKAFADYLDKRIDEQVRVVNLLDPVTLSPSLGFKHSGAHKTLLFGKDGKILKRATSLIDRWGAVLANIFDSTPLDMADAHMMGAYITNLKACKEDMQNKKKSK